MTDFFQKSRIVSCFFFSLCSYSLGQDIASLKIGVVVPLSGLAVSTGKSIKNSIELALEENSSAELKFIFEDDQFDPKNTLTAVRKLIEINNVNGLIVWGTPTALAVNSLSEKAKVPLIAFSMLDKVVEGKSFVMKHWLPARVINENINNEVVKRGIKTVSLVVQLNDSMLKLKDHFLQSSAAQVLSSVEYPREETDFKSQAAKIKSLNPNGVYLLLWAPQVGLFSKQLRAVGYQGMLFGTQNMEDKNEITQANGAM